ncbi:DUF7620 family protein [Streptomyces griseorubiginosus]|uniref:DUF7620 family protein n=1 Tax=Streptomyces griseorubiginosus TaxID=67304 RepID=UPI003D9E7D6E
MRWISRLLRRRPKPTPPRPETPGQQAAEKALSRAQKARREVESHRSAVSEIASRLARERQRNHFAEMFRQAIEGGHR